MRRDRVFMPESDVVVGPAGAAEGFLPDASAAALKNPGASPACPDLAWEKWTSTLMEDEVIWQRNLSAPFDTSPRAWLSTTPGFVGWPAGSELRKNYEHYNDLLVHGPAWA